MDLLLRRRIWPASEVILFIKLDGQICHDFVFFFNAQHPQNFLDFLDAVKLNQVCVWGVRWCSQTSKYFLFLLVCFDLNISCTSPTSWLRRKLKDVTAEHTWPCMFALRQGGVVTTGLFCKSETSRHAPAAVHLQPPLHRFGSLQFITVRQCTSDIKLATSQPATFKGHSSVFVS